MMFGLYETLFLYVVSGTISRCSRRFLDRSGLLRGWSGTVKGCSGNFSRLFWDHSGPFSGCCGTIQDVPGPFQVVPESFQAVSELFWDQCGVLLDLYWCFLAVPGQLRAVPRRSSVSKTPWWGIWKDAFRFWFNIFFIQVPYWFLGLFFLVFFLSFPVLLKTVSVIQMVLVAYEVLLIGSGSMSWAVSAAGVTSVIWAVSISEWFHMFSNFFYLNGVDVLGCFSHWRKFTQGKR